MRTIYKDIHAYIVQYLSTRADVLPQAYIVLLKQLQDSLPPRPVKEVCRTIQKELGKSVDDLFSEFVETPLATASIAQVHRATLNDGRNVVVKVQHEGIKTVILEDLKNAKSIVDWIAWAEPQYDFNPMIDEWCKEAPKELDFNHEAENTRTVSKNLNYKDKRDNAAPGNAVDVFIPEVIQSSEKCLVLEYMDGIRLNDKESLDAFGVDKQKLLEEITRAYAHQIYVDGFFNGDPHPGNFLVSKEPPHRPILLDFGLTKRVSTSMKQGLAKMFLACCEVRRSFLQFCIILMKIYYSTNSLTEKAKQRIPFYALISLLFFRSLMSQIGHSGTVWSVGSYGRSTFFLCAFFFSSKEARKTS
ncbi:protein ACTIVITY OF BC1 COMPLEX KINASE 8, chloroplastic-like [Papaver somniferum]|uniref:protein ACTIVITY OF BC1 COMPLEX KINASE 8, chloroplastic-like n=1 Tax=Papaver somniferum TaxID=3469 RepID=UPI000E6F944A|nr:protein ACTIVITY OF BC1 COMPLEX KINASE 8, chloroplastic-like [Papaver somniferum]